MTAKKFVFTAGFRKVTVYAKTVEDARARARSELDRRCTKEGREPPVGWTLRLKELT